MRVIKLCFLAATCLAVVSFAGCSGGGDSSATDSATDEKIEELTKQVQALDKASAIDAANKKIEELTKQIAALNNAVVIGPDGFALLATPTPVAIDDYNVYGFGLPVPSNVEVTAAGVTGPEASEDNGSVLASAGGTSLMLVWRSVDPPLTPQESVVGAFNVLESLTQSKFEAQGAGAGLTVDSQPSSYGTFVTRDTSGEVAGVGLIGGWVCPNDQRSYAMTVTGAELDSVQQSFVYLANGFRCQSGEIQAAP